MQGHQKIMVLQQLRGRTVSSTRPMLLSWLPSCPPWPCSSRLSPFPLQVDSCGPHFPLALAL